MKERIRILRKYFKLTQAEFGAKIGLSRNAIAQYETGDANPTSTAIHAICEIYGVEYEWLMNGMEPMFKKSREEEITNEILKIYELLSEDKKELVLNFAQMLADKK